MPAERVRVHAAPPQLRAHVLCAIEREVQASAGEPLRAQVHANPFACLNVVVQGRVESAQGPLPARFIAGPFSAPFDTMVGEPLRSCSLVFQPWLLEPVFGLAARDMLDSVVDVAAGRARIDVAREGHRGSSDRRVQWPEGGARWNARSRAAASPFWRWTSSPGKASMRPRLRSAAVRASTAGASSAAWAWGRPPGCA